MCQAFLPIMRPEGRIVNVSSASGNLQQFGQGLQSRFRNPQNTLGDVEALAQEYEVRSNFYATLVNLIQSHLLFYLHPVVLTASEVHSSTYVPFVFSACEIHTSSVARLMIIIVPVTAAMHH